MAWSQDDSFSNNWGQFNLQNHEIHEDRLNLQSPSKFVPPYLLARSSILPTDALEDQSNSNVSLNYSWPSSETEPVSTIQQDHQDYSHHTILDCSNPFSASISPLQPMITNSMQSRPQPTAAFSIPPTKITKSRARIAEKEPTMIHHTQRKAHYIDDDSGSFECGWKDCRSPTTFRSEGSLIRHIKTQHVTPRAFKCPYFHCKRGFNRKDNLEEHIHRIHRSRM